MMREGRPSVNEGIGKTVSTLLEKEGNQTFRELAIQTGLVHKTLLHNIKQGLSLRKIVSIWGPQNLTEIQKLLHMTQRETTWNAIKKKKTPSYEAFLNRDEISKRSYAPK